MNSTAIGQRCLHCGQEFPLYPPLVAGCSSCASDTFLAPVEVVFDYAVAGNWLADIPLAGIGRYATLLPPLIDSISMMEGGTPLVPIADDNLNIFVKDESRNPTWSHKDRFNFCTVSAAISLTAPGIVATSTCNHGASCAAYAARANLPAIVFIPPHPPAVSSFLLAYGQTVVGVPTTSSSWELITRVIDEMDYHPVSNYTNPPTNHPFGCEGYKTIAYEIFLQLGRQAPEAIFVPVGNGELAFGINKGFNELQQFGLIEASPRIISCEPAASSAPLKQAIERDELIVSVEPKDSDAYAVANSTNSLRGLIAVKDSHGIALALTETEIRNAQIMLAHKGIWAEMSAAIAFAGAMKASEIEIGTKGPIICINTSSGFKDVAVGKHKIPEIDGSWQAFIELSDTYY